MFCPSSNYTCPSPSTGTAAQLFSSALEFFATAQCLLSPLPPPDPDDCDGMEFDFIIVGAGTAGCVLANRLSEINEWNVLLLEAGRYPPVESQIPYFDADLYGTENDWGYLSVSSDKIDKMIINRSLNYPRGKMIGGSSSINGMIYNKGSPHDYEQWYKAGNKDWHPDVVKKFFKKLESYQFQNLSQDIDITAEYGSSGPVALNRFNYTELDQTELSINSLDEIGLKRVKDINLPGVFKSADATVSAANGERQSSYKAYLSPVKHRGNLKVLTRAMVVKVLISDQKTAFGVQIERNGKKTTYFARLEVIISAGAINSPQLLMLSGIGDRRHLKSKNIFCKVNLPKVGQNLQDHVAVPITIYGRSVEAPNMSTKAFAAIQYLNNRSGYLACRSNSNVQAFYSSSRSLTYPEYQIHMGIIYKNESNVKKFLSGIYRFKDSVASYMEKLNKKYTLFNYFVILLYPKSRGNISLSTNDPYDPPLIYPNFFMESEDLDSLVKGVKVVSKVVKTKTLRSIGAFLGRIPWPACDIHELDSDEYWKCISRNIALSAYHPVGTCKMGPDPSTSVVDSHLRVHGVRNLRVIDASIMPTITGGNTNAPTYMIGERGADLIKEDHEKDTTQ